MNSPLDWDYADLKKRMEKLRLPGFMGASGAPGHHCAHCVIDKAALCTLGCAAEYRRIYGVEPS